MNIQEAIDLGFDESMVRDSFWEKNSDKVREFKELGFSDDEIREAVEGKVGNTSLLYGDNEPTSDDGFPDDITMRVDIEQDSGSGSMAEVLSSNTMLTEDTMKDVVTPQDNTVTMTPEEMESKGTNGGKVMLNALLEQKELSARMQLRPILGFMAGVENLLQQADESIGKYTGTDFVDEVDDILELVSPNEEWIIEHAKKAGVETVEEWSNPAYVSQVILELLPAAKLRKFFPIFFGETAIGTASAYGSGEDGTISMYKGALQGGIAAAGGKVVEHLLPTGLTYEANIIARKIGISADDAMGRLKGVPTADQARVLAEQAGETGQEYIAKALKDGDELVVRYKELIDERTEVIEKASGLNDIGKVKEEAERGWKIMEDTIDEYGVSIEVDDMVSIVENAKKHSIKTDKSNSVLKNIDKMIKEGDNSLSLKQLVNMRIEVNDLLRTAKGNPKDSLLKLKESISKKIDGGTPEPLKGFIGSTNKLYTDFKTQEKLVDIITKNTKDSGSGDFAYKAMNYSKIIKEIKKQGLDSDVVQETIKASYELDKKFGADKSLITKLKVKGGDPDSGALAVKSSIIGKLKTHLWRFGKFGEDIYVQKSIYNSIKKSKNSNDAIKNLVTNKDLPKEMRSGFVKIISDVLEGKSFSKELDDGLTEVIEEAKKEFPNLGVSPSKGKPTSASKGNQPINLGGKKTPEPKTQEGYGKFPDSANSGAKGGDNQPINLGSKKTPEEPLSKTGGLGMDKAHGGKPSGTGGVNNAKSKATLKTYLDDLANPKVEINQKSVNNLFRKLVDDGDLTYGFTSAKKKAYDNALKAVGAMKGKSKGTAKDKENLRKALQDYMDLI